MKILGIIPARYESSRFPGKPLVDIHGKKMIQRVYEQCVQAKSLAEVIIATDDARIFDMVKSFDGKVIITSANHLNGTSRCNEVVQHFPEAYDAIINIQGDEPFIHPNQIDELAILFNDKTAQIITQAKQETDASLLENPNIVKVLFDENNYAVDFVRFCRQPTVDSGQVYKHIGIYGFKTEVLNKIVSLVPTQNELQHKLEQLRWLDNGYKIKVGITEYESLSIDTKEDLEKAMAQFNL